jgi:hypothetical protein
MRYVYLDLLIRCPLCCPGMRARRCLGVCCNEENKRNFFEQGVAAHGFSLWTPTRMLCDLTPTSRINRTQSVAGNRLFAEALRHVELQQELSEESHTVSCAAAKLKGPCHAQGGPHWRTAEAERFGNAQKTGRKWHSPVGMHLLRAEVMVFTYAYIFLDAVHMVESALKLKGDVSDAPAGAPAVFHTRALRQTNKQDSSNTLSWLYSTVFGTPPSPQHSPAHAHPSNDRRTRALYEGTNIVALSPAYPNALYATQRSSRALSRYNGRYLSSRCTAASRSAPAPRSALPTTSRTTHRDIS